MTTTPPDVRASLTAAIRLDLVAPPGQSPHPGYAGERLPIAPSKWHRTGFLVATEAPGSQRTRGDADETLEEVRRAGDSDDATPELASARKAFFPSSMGLSVLVAAEGAQVGVRVAWADRQQLGRAGDGPGDDDDVHDEGLARLLDLNQKRAEKETLKGTEQAKPKRKKKPKSKKRRSKSTSRSTPSKSIDLPGGDA